MAMVIHNAHKHLRLFTCLTDNPIRDDTKRYLRHKDDRRTIILTTIISPESRESPVMNDNGGVFIGRHLTTLPNGIWLAVCHGRLFGLRRTTTVCVCSWSSILSARIYLFSLLPPFPTPFCINNYRAITCKMIRVILVSIHLKKFNRLNWYTQNLSNNLSSNVIEKL